MNAIIGKEKLWFQSGTANNTSRSNPFVYIEQGVVMLSLVLHTEIAVEEIILNHENRLLKLEFTFDRFKEKVLKSV